MPVYQNIIDEGDRTLAEINRFNDASFSGPRYIMTESAHDIAIEVFEAPARSDY